jgi:hypothetical protein
LGARLRLRVRVRVLERALPREGDVQVLLGHADTRPRLEVLAHPTVVRGRVRVTVRVKVRIRVRVRVRVRARFRARIGPGPGSAPGSGSGAGACSRVRGRGRARGSQPASSCRIRRHPPPVASPGWPPRASISIPTRRRRRRARTKGRCPSRELCSPRLGRHSCTSR